MRELIRRSRVVGPRFEWRTVLPADCQARPTRSYSADLAYKVLYMPGYRVIRSGLGRETGARVRGRSVERGLEIGYDLQPVVFLKVLDEPTCLGSGVRLRLRGLGLGLSLGFRGFWALHTRVVSVVQ